MATVHALPTPMYYFRLMQKARADWLAEPTEEKRIAAIEAAGEYVRAVDKAGDRFRKVG